MPNPLFDALLAPHRGSHAPFIIHPDGQVVSYGEFLNNVARAAHALSACGLKPGDRLALQAEKSVSVLEIYGASLLIGAIFLPLNTAYTDSEVDYFLDDAKPGLFICDPERQSGLSASAAGQGTRILTISAMGRGSFTDLATGMPAKATPAERGGDDIAALLYTSGTTGRSKGAMLTQDNLLSNARVLQGSWDITAGDRLLHALPLYHTHGLFVAVNTTLVAGASMIFLTGFKLELALAALPEATTMMGVPTFYTRLLEDDRFTADLVRKMRLFISGSAPLLTETHKAFEARTGHRILERYGMTETGMNTSNPYDGERRAGSVGFPLPEIDIRITDGDGGTGVEPGQVGMIEVRGPNVFKGYWGMPEKTREELRENGYFITGDLGHRDADGYLHIVGRNKDLIISGGYNVYPKEIELVLDDAGWVKESAVIGVPHPDFGEGVVAVVVPMPEGTPDLPGLKAAAAGRLAKYKQPKAIILVDDLPRNTMGKVQKNVLRDTYADQFAQKAI